MKAILPKQPSMNEMLRQAQKMQEDMQATQAELEAKEYEAQAGGGVVKVKVNGKKEVLSIEIDKEIVDPDDVETLQDIIVAGVNEALKKASQDSEERMGQITGSMPSIPGLF